MGLAEGDGRQSTRKRKAIVEAATTTFLQKGYLGTSMDEIATLAGVSKQTVYKHFADKEALFSELVTATVAEAGSLPWVRHGDRLVELVLRGGRYAIRVRDPRAAERAAFDGIPTFDVDPSWIRPGRFTPLAEPKAVTVDTARADLRQQVVTVGTVEISFPDGPRTLLATAGQGGRLNLSFRDRTNGELTAPWRVVSTSIPTETGSLVVDFNRTVNLPFAFTEYGTCPAPVPENTLPLAVTAGELAPVRVTP